MKQLVILTLILMLGFVNAQSQSIEIMVENIAFELVFVEGGEYQKGAPQKTIQATVADFYIAKTEVTQELWKTIMGKNPSVHRGKKNPVDNVSYDMCIEFITKLNHVTGKQFRLPTTTEWEYAARGGNQSKGFKFSGADIIGKIGWYANNSNGSTNAVATKMPNELGLYDMSGNLWEWCADIAAVSTMRKMRGGSWNDTSQACWVWNEQQSNTNSGSDLCGLRLVLDKQ